MIHQIKNFIIHRCKSFHLHGIHSPFIFQFQHKAIYGNQDKSIKDEIIRFRESVKNNHTLLNIEDHGAGSHKFKTDTRKVSEILKHNSTPLKRSLLLYRICDYLKIDNSLELGTSLGIGTQAIALSGAQVTSIEASQAVYESTKSRLNAFENIQLIHNTFQRYIDDDLPRLNPSYDLIFIDGHHDGMATMNYFERLLPYSHDHTVFILDDIYWSEDMTRVWKTLQQHERVTASIDGFFWGFLFLRKEQQQEQFYINLKTM